MKNIDGSAVPHWGLSLEAAVPVVPSSRIKQNNTDNKRILGFWMVSEQKKKKRQIINMVELNLFLHTM